MSEEKQYRTDYGYEDGLANIDPVGYVQQTAGQKDYRELGKSPVSAVDTEMSMLADAYKGLNDALSELERRLAPVLVPELPTSVGDGHIGEIKAALNPAMQSPLQGKIASRRAEAERVTRKVKKILGSLAI